MLATQGIRGGANREVLKRIKEKGDIFFAESDRPWILAGATVHVSMIGFDRGAESSRVLDGKSVAHINANLTTQNDLTRAAGLIQNEGLCLRASEKGGHFILEEFEALRFLAAVNPHGKPNSDVIRPWTNSDLLLRGIPHKWIIDFFGVTVEEQAARYEAPFQFLLENVKMDRQSNRDARLAKYWWLHRRSAEDMRVATKRLARFIVTPSVAKHRTFSWCLQPLLPDHQLYAFAGGEDYLFGILHSRSHEVWSLAQGTQLREKESGFRYTPTTCFETFPFPFPDDLAEQPDELQARLDAAKHYKHITLREESAPYSTGHSGNEISQSPAEHHAAIAGAAHELNELRERWLNPPEWTVEKILRFPGRTDGPWRRFLAPKTVDVKTGIGTVRYPRLEPRDAECAAKLKTRTLTNLYNERPAWLDWAHKKLDAAVAAAYGWPADLTDEQILERLLALNLKRAAEEAQPAEQELAGKRLGNKLKSHKAQREKKADELV